MNATLLQRTHVMELLTRALPVDDKERADLEQMRRAAEELASPFSRAEPTAHFTGSALILDPSGAQVCMIFHRKLQRWLQPGGHAEASDGGDLAATALREAREETGLQVELHPHAPRPLDVDAHRIPARGDEPEHMHLDVRFLMVASHVEALRGDVLETSGAKWLPLQEAIQRADEPALKRLLTKAASWGSLHKVA